MAGGSEQDVCAPGDVIGGKYEVEHVLGSGGMGIVVAARHQGLGRRFALKFLSPRLAQEAELAARFRREARAAVQLRGEHVVSVVDVGELPSGCPYLVMEYLEGDDLHSALDRCGPLPVDEVVDYVLQACEALAEAHAAGIVHRDVKPANLFLTHRPDGSALIKVVDFGISKLALADALDESRLTETRTVLGSPNYMAPEQIRGASSVDRRADIWSLGVTLHELVADRLPFRGESLTAISAAIVADLPVPLRHHRPDAPAELEAVVLRCLEKDPDRRYQDAGELAGALSSLAPEHSRLAMTRAVDIARGSSPRLRVAERNMLADADTVVEQAGNGPEPRQDAETLAATVGTVSRRRGRRRWLLPAVVAGALVAASVVALTWAPAPAPELDHGAERAAAALGRAVAVATIPPPAVAHPVEAPIVAPAPEPTLEQQAPIARSPEVATRSPRRSAVAAPSPAAPAPAVPVEPTPSRYDPLSDRK
jgi:eukaryotic-like serine/threonine-protein kinase